MIDNSIRGLINRGLINPVLNNRALNNIVLNKMVAPRRWMLRVMAFVAIALLSCTATVTTARAIPIENLIFQGIQAAQLSNLSDRKELQIGTQMHQNLLSKGVRLSQNGALNRYVIGIGERLRPYNRRPRLPYSFFVVQDRAVNAFATMGGYVYVTTGLLATADNEAQVASVIGHEMGHIERKHLLQQIRKTMLAQGLAVTLLGQNRSQLANIGVDLLVRRPLSREDEYQADQVGLRMLRDADYATSAMPAFMQKLVRGSGGSPTILSTHPAVPDRLRALENAIEKGPTNRCDYNDRQPICGLDEQAYQGAVKQQLRV